MSEYCLEIETVVPRENVGGSIERSSWAFSAILSEQSVFSAAIVVVVGNQIPLPDFKSDFIYSPHSSSWV